MSPYAVYAPAIKMFLEMFIPCFVVIMAWTAWLMFFKKGMK